MKLALVALLGATACGCPMAACTPQEQATVAKDATKAQAWIYGSCYVAKAATADDPFVTVACALAEDIDGALQTLGQKGVTQVRIVCSTPPAPKASGGGP